MNLSSQTLDALWKRHAEAVSKDLPRTQIEVLDSIIDLATTQKQYGHLIKAQLKHVEAVTAITPDSLESEVKRRNNTDTSSRLNSSMWRRSPPSPPTRWNRR